MIAVITYVDVALLLALAVLFPMYICKIGVDSNANIN